MKPLQYSHLAMLAALSACGVLTWPVTGSSQGPQEAEILTRGPLHEAFAEAVGRDPEPGILINTAPPEPIDELPPDLQPEGDNVTWIAGYWAWDEETEDFLWISGIWRNIPPDREWVPGYWSEAGSQFQWTSGYWADLEEEDIAYLPKPPASVESGPNVPQPSDSHTWIPGGWVWAEGRYLWRPGYWEVFREDWTYIPDCYQWTPRGYLYVAGYWDYPVEHRGVVFAPVRFHREVYGRPDYRYEPTTVISLTLITNHLFVRPNYGHYYYGDYYDPGYRDRGFFASFSYHSGPRGGYDPIYAHQRWEHRHDGDWDRRCRDDFEYFRDHRDDRPPHFYSKLKDLADGRRGFHGRHGDYAIATPIRHFDKDRKDAPRFKKVENSTRERLLAQRKAMNDFRQTRKHSESSHRPESGKSEAKVPPIKAHRSPVAGRKAEQMSKEKAPPQRRGHSSVVKRDDDSKGKSSPGRTEEPKRGGSPSTPKMDPRRGGVKEEPKSEPGRGGTKSKVVPLPGPGKKPDPGEHKGSERKPEKKVMPLPGPGREKKPEPKMDPRRGGTKPEPKREVKPEPRREVKPERKPEPRREEPRKVEPRREVKPEPRREVKPEPRREAPRKVEPRREVKPEPRREAPRKVEPRREVKPEPRREEPRRVEPKPQPKREEAPSRGGRSGGDDDDKKSKKR